MTVPYTFANRTGNIPLSELDANFSNVGIFANTAGTVTTAAQPNITLVGTLSSLTVSGAGSMASLAVSGAGSMANLTVSGNVTANNIIGTVSGNISNAVFATSAGTVTTNAQPNITTVGTLTTLSVTGNISAVGNVLPGNVVSTGLLRGLTVQATGNLVGGNANISTSVNTPLVVADNITVGNISTTGNLTVTGNIEPGNVVSIGLLRGLTVQADGNLVGGNANISTSVNTVTVNASNVAATRITATGNVTVARLNTVGNLSVGNTLSSLTQTKAANAAGIAGEICWDGDYIYVCTATNTWKRAALTGGY
jgi:hypothetical protein